jgi:hypothetical protein
LCKNLTKRWRNKPAKGGQRGAENIWNSPPEQTSEK